MMQSAANQSPTSNSLIIRENTGKFHNNASDPCVWDTEKAPET